MTYGIPRPTAVKGNVTIKAAKRGLTKKEVPCSTCVESSDINAKNCSACTKTKTPTPLITLTGFDNGINGSYSLGYYPTTKITPLLKLGAVGIDFGGGAYCRYGMRERQNLGTIDAQWPLVVKPDIHGNYHLPHYDSTLLDGEAGLSCRKVEYVVGTRDYTCYECGIRYYDEPSAMSAALRMEIIYHVKPLVVEMGYRHYQDASHWYPERGGGGTWERSNPWNGGWRQIVAARRFNVAAGITLVIHRTFALTEIGFNGYSSSEIGSLPIDSAVYHADIAKSSTSTDKWFNPLLECFGINTTMELVAKTIKSDSLIKNHMQIVERGRPSCSFAPVQSPPFNRAQTATLFNQVNDFGTAGTVQLSTSEAILDIFLGNDLAAEIEADASCTVTDG
tara:strand:+ start:1175 stop:2350 length:1176 start_codon:yes stop_codon:yes gene_type:complete